MTQDAPTGGRRRRPSDAGVLPRRGRYAGLVGAVGFVAGRSVCRTEIVAVRVEPNAYRCFVDFTVDDVEFVA